MIPEFLNNLLNSYYDSKTVTEIIDGYQKKVVTLRVNTIKSNLNEVKETLANNQITYTSVPWYSNALIITNANEERIRSLDIYHNGYIYLQSLY